jgi:hypothetical protein
LEWDSLRLLERLPLAEGVDEREDLLTVQSRHALDLAQRGAVCTEQALGYSGGRSVAGPAAACHHLQRATRIIAAFFTSLYNRSKCNVALGIEAQGFRVLR